jgi:DNA modification methylase
MTNALYYGDNLDVLRHEIAGDSVDLIYLDPPFNSQANYNGDAPVPRRKRRDGLSGDDGCAADRIAPRPKADRLALSALRPHRQPLFENIA